MTKADFIKDMQARAASYPIEAQRCRKEWRALATIAFIWSGVCFFLSVIISMWLPSLVLALGSIAWGCAGLSNLKTGNTFARKWMELREEALNNVNEEERRP